MEKEREQEEMVETKVCEECGRRLPITRFTVTTKGNHMKMCMDCINRKRMATRKAKERAEMLEKGPVSDPMFDDKDPREVLEMMGAAKKWLESRGFTIQLSGYFMQRREIKF